MEFWFLLVAIAAAIGLALAIPLVRAIRARLAPTWPREILVAVVRGLLIAPSVVLGGHGSIAMPTVACLPLWLLKYPEHFNLWYLAPFAIVATFSLLASASGSRSGLAPTARPVVRFGIWLPFGALAVAAGLFFLADHVIVRPGGESNANYAFFALLLLLGIAAAGVAVVVLLSSLWTLKSLRDGSVPAVDLTSAVVGLVTSVIALGFFIVQGTEASKAQQRSEEEAALWRAIQEADSRSFSAALAGRKRLALDSQTAYSLLFWSIENKQLSMAVALVEAGMPLLKEGDAHPELVGEYVRRQQLHDPEQLAAMLLEVASMAGEKDLQTLSAALKRAREDHAAQRLAQRRDAALKESLANEISSDARFGFGASMSSDVLRAAKEGRFPPLETRNTNGETVLFFALRDEKQCGQAPQLIQSGVDVRQVNHLKVTPLMLAAGNCNNETVRLLLERGVDLHARSFDGSTALMYASVAGQQDNVRLLLAAGAQVSARTDKGETALSLARQQGFDQIVKTLEQARR